MSRMNRRAFLSGTSATLALSAVAGRADAFVPAAVAELGWLEWTGEIAYEAAVGWLVGALLDWGAEEVQEWLGPDPVVPAAGVSFHERRSPYSMLPAVTTTYSEPNRRALEVRGQVRLHTQRGRLPPDQDVNLSELKAMARSSMHSGGLITPVGLRRPPLPDELDRFAALRRARRPGQPPPAVDHVRRFTDGQRSFLAYALVGGGGREPHLWWPNR